MSTFATLFRIQWNSPKNGRFGLTCGGCALLPAIIVGNFLLFQCIFDHLKCSTVSKLFCYNDTFSTNYLSLVSGRAAFGISRGMPRMTPYHQPIKIQPPNTEKGSKKQRCRDGVINVFLGIFLIPFFFMT